MDTKAPGFLHESFRNFFAVLITLTTLLSCSVAVQTLLEVQDELAIISANTSVVIDILANDTGDRISGSATLQSNGALISEWAKEPVQSVA